jgi:hypothetical protein
MCELVAGIEAILVLRNEPNSRANLMQPKALGFLKTNPFGQLPAAGCYIGKTPSR